MLSLDALPELLLVGGKGGVGKTTVAAATALHLARSLEGRRILVASTDPAHSLGDALGLPLEKRGEEPVSVRPGLDVWEFDAPEMGERFFEEHRDVLRVLLDRGTYLDEEDVEAFLSLSLPGLDEVMAILEIARLEREGSYDLIVVDTAPTGHTLRLLMLPDGMASWLRVLELMQHKYRYMKKRFAGRYRRDSADRFIEETSRDLERLAALLRNPQKTAFMPVLIPEPMAVNETARLLEFLAKRQIQLSALVVNRVPSASDCPLCMGRFREAETHRKEIAERFASCERIEVPLLPVEVAGLERLAALGSMLFGEAPLEASALEGGREKRASKRHRAPKADFSELLRQPLRFLLFSGKGGVGKTSLSVATSLQRARAHPEERILLFSTDPAHSLSDSLDMPIGNQVVKVAGNLHALEIDAAAVLEDFKRDYRDHIEEGFSRLVGPSADLPFDRVVFQEMIEASPPGIDELMALIRVMELEKEFDLFVLDTAPTGHLLRFLEMPDLVRSWLKVIFRVLLKQGNAMSFDQLTEDLLELARDIRQLRSLLTDPAKTRFVAVAIPEALAVMETRRLLAGVAAAQLHCEHLIVNMLVPRSGCDFCEKRRASQIKHAAALENLDSNLKVTHLPFLPGEVRGRKQLEHVAGMLF